MTAGTAGRYEGKPFLRLLECYVLWAVGQLDAGQQAQLDELTPKLQATYGVDGPWPEIVAGQMELSEEVPAALRGMWDRNQEAAAEAGTVLDPEEWARQVVDANFA